jgi:hypothetical protein
MGLTTTHHKKIMLQNKRRKEACMEEMRNAYKILVGKPKGKRPLGRPRYRLEDNIKIDLRKIGLEGVGWIHLDQDRD